MDIKALVDDYFAWKENPDHPFHTAKILHENGPIVVLVPTAYPQYVVKFSDRDVDGLKAEYESLRRIQTAGVSGELFALPQAVSFERFGTVQCLTMTNMGEDLRHQVPSPALVEQAGKAIGAFAADLLKKDGSTHNDLFWGNLTLTRDNRIGIIDLMSICPIVEPVRPCDFRQWGDTPNVVETMFRAPLAQDEDLAGPMAAELVRAAAPRLPSFKLSLPRMLDLTRAENWNARRAWRPDSIYAVDIDQKIMKSLKRVEKRLYAEGLGKYIIPLTKASPHHLMPSPRHG